HSSYGETTYHTWTDNRTLIDGTPQPDVYFDKVTLAVATPTATPCAMSFTDVQSTDYFYTAVRYLYCRSIVSGYGDNTFRPYNTTTRGQLCKIVVLAEGWALYTPPTPTFRDVPVSNAFYQYIETAYSHNIISGYSCGTDCLEFR